ncbi:MAG: Gfo/Idh/MocA family protein [Promethearchaeota archaeon]
MKKLKVGLIGLGNVAEVHLEAYKQVKQVDVVAGAELKKERLDQMTRKWGFNGYLKYEEMLENEALDIACVLVPARFHREVSEKVAGFSVNILCEKPLAVTLEDAKAIIEICKSKKVKLCYGATYRWLSTCLKAKEMIDKGYLGKINLLMETSISGNGAKNFKDAGDHHYPRGGLGGGMMGLVDHGIHLIDMFRWLINSEVESVVGRGNISGQSPFTEFLTLFFKNGAIGQLVYNEATYSSDLPCEGIFSWGGSWDINGNLKLEGHWDDHPGNIRIHGEKGALRVFHYANKLFYFSGGKIMPIKVLDKPMPGNFAMQMESFANSILRDEEPEVNGLEGLKALQILHAAYESFETKKFVKVKY